MIYITKYKAMTFPGLQDIMRVIYGVRTRACNNIIPLS